MNLFKKIKHSTLKKIMQSSDGRNRAALYCLLQLGFTPTEIRPALMKLNRIKIKTLVDGHRISIFSLYNTVNGVQPSPLAKRLIARSLGLGIDELFPPTTTNPNPSPPVNQPPQTGEGTLHGEA